MGLSQEDRKMLDLQRKKIREGYRRRTGRCWAGRERKDDLRNRERSHHWLLAEDDLQLTAEQLSPVR